MKKLFTYTLAILFAIQLTAQGSYVTKTLGNIENQYIKKRESKTLFNPIYRTNAYQIPISTLMGKKAISEKLDSTVSEIYDNVNFNIEDYTTYQFNENGTLISIHFYEWKENEKRFTERKSENSYDTNGNVSVTSYSFLTNNIWSLDAKTLYEYNSDGKITKEILLVWSTVLKDWEEYTKIENEYDLNKNLVKTTFFRWENSQWELDNKYEYEYDMNDKLSKTYGFLYEEDISDWLYFSKLEINNNTDGNALTSIEYSWDDKWENDTKNTYTYDSNKNIKELLIQYWDEDSLFWIDYKKFEFEYNMNMSIEDVLFPKNQLGLEKYNMNNKILTMSTSSFESKWVLTDKEIYNYSPISTSSINKTNFASTKVYPNPAKDMVNFDLSNIPSANEILVFDMNGKQVAKYDVNNNNQSINVSQLSKGFYLYKIIGNDNISSGKLIIE